MYVEAGVGEHVLAADGAFDLFRRRGDRTELDRELVDDAVSEPVETELVEEVGQFELRVLELARVVRVEVDGAVFADDSGARPRVGGLGCMGKPVQRTDLADLQQTAPVEIADNRN